MPALLRHLLLIVLLGACAASEVAAQGTGTPLRTPLGPRTREDTVRAVRRLFAAKAGTGAAAVSQGGVLLAGIGVVALAPKNIPFVGLPSPPVVAATLVVGGANALAGVLRLRRYGNNRRDQVLAAYAQGEPLPPFVLQRLRPKHFGPEQRQPWARRLVQLRNVLR